jgi:hypothetical protein
LARPRLEIAERELRSVVNGLVGSVSQRAVLVDDAFLVKEGLHLKHGLFRRLEHCVEPPEDGHGKDHVAVLAAHAEVAKDVVRDPPG